MCPCVMWSLLLVLFLLQPVYGDDDDYHPDFIFTKVAANATAPDPAERDAPYWYAEAFAAIDERLAAPQYDAVAKHVIMFLGDGMSVPTLAAARALRGQRAGRTGEEERLAFERFPITGLSKTYCVSGQVADSACSGTAYLCGVKANGGTIGVTAAVPILDCAASANTSTHLESIAAWALADGRSAGIVTTTRVTHASPANAYAHAASRRWESDGRVRTAGHDPALCPDIAHQLINTRPGNQFQVILGGGRREFRPNTTKDEEMLTGARWDGRDLIQEWREQRKTGESSAYIWNRTALLDAIANPPDNLLGLFRDSHMLYAAEARQSGADQPSLAEMTEAAIRVLSKNPRGFFLFVEGGRIDMAHHENLPHLALDETLELDKAVARADSLLPPANTLLVVTADHAHVMTYNGYPSRGHNILGASNNVGTDGVPYMTLSYANGPGYRKHVNNKRVDVTMEDNFQELRWKTHVEVPLPAETHGGDDVAVFARGPAQALFAGLYEQSQLPHLMAHAACLGPAGARRAACVSTVSVSSAAPAALSASIVTLALALVAALLRLQ